MRATLVAKRPKTTSVASTTNQSAPTFSASASAPLATYVLIATVTPFPLETNRKFRVARCGCQRSLGFEQWAAFGERKRRTNRERLGHFGPRGFIRGDAISVLTL